jgi:oligopeptide transport system substrate-binding protein
VRAGAALGLAALALGLVALAQASRQLSLPRADFAFCNQNEIASLDPHMASDVSSGRILGALYEGLTRIDPQTGAPAPALASSWSVSDDGLTWTFAIRPEARWSNGEVLDASDVVDGWLRLLHPSTAARNAELLWIIDGARGYTATPADRQPDASQVGLRATHPGELNVRLVRPVPYLASLLAYWPLVPVHLDSIAEHGHDWLRPEHLVVNGPFLLHEHRLRDRIRLVRNPQYWDAEHVALETIDAYAAASETTQLNMYLTGLVDWVVKPPPALYGSLRERDDWRSSGQLGMSFLRFNTTRPPFDDPKVRAALALALDRDALTRDVLGGGQRAASSFVPPGLGDYAPAHFPPGDPERARALLA